MAIRFLWINIDKKYGGKKSSELNLSFSSFVCPACAYALGFKSRTVKVDVAAS
jgi:hypothetical protein